MNESSLGHSIKIYLYLQIYMLFDIQKQCYVVNFNKINAGDGFLIISQYYYNNEINYAFRTMNN